MKMWDICSGSVLLTKIINKVGIGVCMFSRNKHFYILAFKRAKKVFSVVFNSIVLE